MYMLLRGVHKKTPEKISLRGIYILYIIYHILMYLCTYMLTYVYVCVCCCMCMLMLFRGVDKKTPETMSLRGMYIYVLLYILYFS
jgi:DNA replicative helicase MCM subunit Mcm2 (Cdc46/Mcm family)